MVGYSFVRKNFKIKNQITVRKKFSRATKWDHPRFFIFFGLEVTAFPRCTTVLCLLDYRHSDLFTLVGYSFVREDSNVNQLAKGIKWSAVSLPCFSLLTFGKQGSGPGRGQSPVEWGDFTYVRTYKCLSVHWAGSYIDFIFLSLQNRTIFHILHKKLIP